MRNIFLFFVPLFLSQLLNAQVERCAFDTYRNQLMSSEEYRRVSAVLEEQLQRTNLQKSETVFVIPLVFHIIYNGAQQNISDAQILSQLDILNEDFRKLNSDTNLVELGFSYADTKIEFCLARRDPQGQETSGINRIATNLNFIGTNDQYFQIQPAWDRDRYLNIWVGNYGKDNFGNDILGRASPPGEPNANRDGVIITYQAFGNIGTATSPYNKGRTTTHEVGHWLGLYHPWGVNAVSCADDDLVQDTPNQGQVYYNCPPVPRSSCGSKDMLSNYMGYVDDACMGNFTEGQKERMRNTLVLQRSSILLSKGCLSVGLEEREVELDLSIFPNPVEEQLFIDLKSQILGQFRIRIMDMGGRVVLEMEKAKATSKISIPMEDIGEGIYLIDISSEEGHKRSKIIVQH